MMFTSDTCTNPAETGLYYLNSRYYSPEFGRFINADGQLNGDLLGYNLYLYCGNNPVNNQDSSGQFWDIALDVVFTVGSLITIAKNPTDLKAWAALGADLICMAVPFATDGGIAVRAASKVDNVIDAGRVANKADNTTNSMTTLYRSVSSFEANDIVATGRFNLLPTGMEAKQLVWITMKQYVLVRKSNHPKA